MTISEQIDDLTEGDRVLVTTSHEWLTEKEYMVSEMCSDERTESQVVKLGTRRKQLL